jgi:hypothetical protein
MKIEIVHEPPGEWQIGLWKTDRNFSIRLFKWALVWRLK